MKGVRTIGGRNGKTKRHAKILQYTQDNRMHMKSEMKERLRVSCTFSIPCITIQLL